MSIKVFIHIFLYRFWPPYTKRHNDALISLFPDLLRYKDEIKKEAP